MGRGEGDYYQPCSTIYNTVKYVCSLYCDTLFHNGT